MDQGISLFVYPVKDLAQAKALYGKFLGVEPYADGAYYVGYRVGDQELGLDPNGHNKGVTGPIGYRRVGDIKKSLQSLLDAGAQLRQEIKDVGGGRLIAWVADARRQHHRSSPTPRWRRLIFGPRSARGTHPAAPRVNG
jgi:catechol 2,3-dioxygenase-like lactoylglutathione lyase family enzyme